MMSIAAITIVTLVGLLFAAMAVAPALIETRPAKSGSTTKLVLVDTGPSRVSEPEHPRAA
ncbi:MAG: hypothetical protein H0T72_00890 [Chloroflexia bacterium]|jgi:uncharacterized protein YcnI|nr:hypothetical protein [Chloroflexia bacterium]